MKYLKKILFCSVFILNLCNGWFDPVGLFLGFQYSCQVDKDLLASDRWSKALGASFGANLVGYLSNLLLSDKEEYTIGGNKYTIYLITNKKLQALHYLLRLGGGVLGYYYINKAIEMKKKSMTAS